MVGQTPGQQLMHAETALLQRLAHSWEQQQALLLLNPPDDPTHYSDLNLCGVLHDRYDQFLRWSATATDTVPVWFDTRLPAAEYSLAASPPTTVVMFLPKGKARLTAQLQLLASSLSAGSEVVLIGAIKSGIKSAGKIMSTYCSEVSKLDAARHCQALRGKLTKRPNQPDVDVAFDALYGSWSLSMAELQPASANVEIEADPDNAALHNTERLPITTLPGVFASGHLDPGSHLLLLTLLEHREQLPRSGSLLDYGCGSGVLSLIMHQLLPMLSITAVDVDSWALQAANKTLTGVDQLRILPSAKAGDIDGRYDLIVSNPPFHQNFLQTTSTTAGFLQQLPQLLASRGQCWLVANRFLPYEQIINSAGLKLTKVVDTPEYKIIRISRTGSANKPARKTR